MLGAAPQQRHDGKRHARPEEQPHGNDEAEQAARRRLQVRRRAGRRVGNGARDEVAAGHAVGEHDGQVEHVARVVAARQHDERGDDGDARHGEADEGLRALRAPARRLAHDAAQQIARVPHEVRQRREELLAHRARDDDVREQRVAQRHDEAEHNGEARHPQVLQQAPQLREVRQVLVRLLLGEAHVLAVRLRLEQEHGGAAQGADAQEREQRHGVLGGAAHEHDEQRRHDAGHGLPVHDGKRVRAARDALRDGQRPVLHERRAHSAQEHGSNHGAEPRRAAHELADRGQPAEAQRNDDLALHDALRIVHGATRKVQVRDEARQRRHGHHGRRVVCVQARRRAQLVARQRRHRDERIPRPQVRRAKHRVNGVRHAPKYDCKAWFASRLRREAGACPPRPGASRGRKRRGRYALGLSGPALRGSWVRAAPTSWRMLAVCGIKEAHSDEQTAARNSAAAAAAAAAAATGSSRLARGGCQH